MAGDYVDMGEEYKKMTTDELLDALPDHLYVARNDEADPEDRWRIYNRVTKKYIDPGYPTVRDLMINTLKILSIKVNNE